MKGPWEGDWPLNTTWRYSSGGPHYSWDVGCPIGTKLMAIGNGVVVDCQDGVKDQPPGVPAGSGAPSNWLILKFMAPAGRYKGKHLYAYYQHLTKGGVLVRKGQRVKEGEVIARSGNSGNTTGPHLHLTILKPGYSMNRYTRYNYLANPGMVVWTPDDAWGNTKYDKQIHISFSKLRPGVDNSLSVRFLRKCLISRGLLHVEKPLSKDHPGNKYTDAVKDAVKLWQKRHGFPQSGTLTKKQAELFFLHNKHVVLEN